MKTALILVDIQNDYFPGGRMELVGMEAAAAGAAGLLTRFRKESWPTIHIQHEAVHEGATFFLPHTEGAELHTSIQPQPHETVIRKHFPNSFRQTRLHERLQEARVDHIVICGAMSHMCIDATTRAAVDLGYRCTVIHDACATRDLEFEQHRLPAVLVHGAFMAALGMGYAELTAAESYLRSR
jgi:nicotinamidase-related amidase